MQLLFDHQVKILIKENKSAPEILNDFELKRLGFTENQVKNFIYDCIYQGALGSLAEVRSTPSIHIIKHVMFRSDEYVDWQIQAIYPSTDNKTKEYQIKQQFKQWFRLHRHNINPQEILNYHILKDKGISDEDLNDASGLLDI